MAVGQEAHIEISQEVSIWINKTDKVPEPQIKQEINPEIFKETRILSVQYGRGSRSSHRDQPGSLHFIHERLDQNEGLVLVRFRQQILSLVESQKKSPILEGNQDSQCSIWAKKFTEISQEVSIWIYKTVIVPEPQIKQQINPEIF